MSRVADVEFFLMSRLEEFFGDVEDPWQAGFDREMVESSPMISESYSAFYEAEGHALRWTGEEHAGRVRFLMTNPYELEVPIEIDCECDRGHIYAIPVLLDGWHRYMAHRLLKAETIPVSFGGRVDLAEYLRGDIHQVEED